MTQFKSKLRFLLTAIALGSAALGPSAQASERALKDDSFQARLKNEKEKKWEVATLSGGCFWGMEKLLLEIPGVLETQVGYTGGKTPKATYEEVHLGLSGHAEAVQILFDPRKLSYEKLLLRFFTMHDPTTLDRQGNDIGSQYRSSIFFESDAQKKTAEAVRAKVDRSGKWGKPVVTRIVQAGEFWRAEEYHQKYLVKHPAGYTCHYIRKLSFD